MKSSAFRMEVKSQPLEKGKYTITNSVIFREILDSYLLVIWLICAKLSSSYCLHNNAGVLRHISMATCLGIPALARTKHGLLTGFFFFFYNKLFRFVHFQPWQTVCLLWCRRQNATAFQLCLSWARTVMFLSPKSEK